ncbi:MAG: dual specificity protein phosphatase family protein [Aigarchaeota archaeon]|nr:dual specificity protein phosphatase family protein [Aigarchaeota archaeon]MDW8092212.1 dual specificity protein phosphatase family protein [Nitrososphaerota archaeon]
MDGIGEFYRRVLSLFVNRPPRFGWVSDHLAGSGEPKSRRQMVWLRNQGISSVLSLTEDPLRKDLLDGLDIEYMHIPVRNHTKPTLDQLLSALEFIDRSIASKRRVLVHCAAGKGRTGTVLAAYMVHKNGLRPQEAIEHIRRLRPGSIERVQESSVYELMKWKECCGSEGRVDRIRHV